MEDDKIKYSDLISPDDSIKILIAQLGELNKAYGTVLEVVKTGARDIVAQLKTMSTANSEGRAEIDEATAAANRLARAQKELRFAISDTGKEVAWLKSQTASQNKMTIDQQKRAQALAGSYDKIKLQVKDLTRRYKELSEAERGGEKGDRLLGQLLDKKQKLADLDNQMKLHIKTVSAVEKAEQKLAFLRSAEGKRLLELKQLISSEINANRTRKAALDEVTLAQKRLAEAQATSRQMAHELNIQAREANRVSKLQAMLNINEAGSYNALAAQYELNKIKLNKMSAAMRQTTEEGKQLEKETLELYMQMQKFQEATGNHRLSVGNYAKSWDGLGMSVAQVVRELPAAAVSMNTFFLGISNNIPILMDEIKKLKDENKQLLAQGKQGKSVIGSLTKALFSWNTLLVIGLTVLSMHGKEIIDWIGKLVKGKSTVMSLNDALDNMQKKLEETDKSYGNNLVTFKKLADEWKGLTTKKEQLQWIRDNKTEFDKLDVSVRNVNDAENIFVENTETMIAVLQLRAKALAASTLASEKYQKHFAKLVEYQNERRKGPSGGDRFKGTMVLNPGNMPGDAPHVTTPEEIDQANKAAEEAREKRLKDLKEESDVLKKEGDQYYNIARAYYKYIKSRLEWAGIEEAHRYKNGRDRNPRPRDLTDQIWRNDLTIRKKYELSLSDLQRDEYKKRRIEAIDQANQTIREMQEKFRKNQVFLLNPEGKFKPLTEEQKAQIEQQQKEITAIIENTRRKLEITLTEIDNEHEVEELQNLRERMKERTDIIAADIEKEKQLRLKQLDDLEAKYTTKGATIEGEAVVTGQMTPEQLAVWHRKREKIIAEYDAIVYKMKAEDIEAQLLLVKKGSDAELKILLDRNENARKLALAENKLKPITERRSEKEINAQYDKSGNLIRGNFSMTSFDELQAAQAAEYEVEKRSSKKLTIFKLTAERDRWKKQIKLAEEGALEWSDAQLREANAMVKKLNRLIGEAENTFSLSDLLGLDDKQMSALEDAANIIIDNIKQIAAAEVEAAEIAVKAAEKRVEAAQNAYDAEVEGRNNGYANNVATAKKELQQEKKNQAQKQKILEEAQRRQQAIDTISQTSSLITASANLWSVFSKAGFAGPALAIAAIAAMWASFAAAKIKAAEVTRASSQEYGEGGLEFLEGGSHASGNDIDLQTKNSRGKNMRAEGGEAMAIINKRNTRKYRRVLPSIVDSLNKGVFEDKFSQAFKSGDELSQNISYQQNIDLSQIEEDVRALKRNSENQYYAMPDGSYIEKKGNVVRRIH